MDVRTGRMIADRELVPLWREPRDRIAIDGSEEVAHAQPRRAAEV